MRRETSNNAAGGESIELRHLRYFIAVAEHANFSRAAEALGTAQPSLSQQIRQLEGELGVALFVRGKRRIMLTAAGSTFLSEARALIDQLGVAVRHAREAGRGMRGELRIAYSVSVMMSTLPLAIRAYRIDHPDVRISLRATAPSAIADALREREADIGVLLAPAAWVPPTEIELRRLGAMPIGIVVAVGHRLARRSSVRVAEIDTDTLILFARSLATLYDATLTFCQDEGFVPTRIEEADRIETVLGLVAAGEGVSLVPQPYEKLGFPGVVYTTLQPAPEPLTLAAVWNRATHSTLAAAFVATCERVVARDLESG